VITRFRKYEIDDDPARVDFARVHDWLERTYWAAGRSRAHVERSARHSSLVVGAYLDREQVGFMRVVSDRMSFAWVASRMAITSSLVTVGRVLPMAVSLASSPSRNSDHFSSIWGL
jgi:hypothetical protein